MTKKDWKAILGIGGGVGLLIQPIIANTLANVHLTILERIGVFVFFLLFAPFALWISSLIGKFVKWFYQFAQFGAVGTLNSFIDVGVFNLETFLFGTPYSVVPFAVFKAFSFLCATTNSFAWNKYWTFKSTEKATTGQMAGQVTGFYTVAIIGWVLNVAIATFVKSVGPQTKLWIDVASPLAGILTTFIWNFLGYKYFVFKKQSGHLN